MSSCTRRYGSTLDRVCDGTLVKLASGLLDLFYCCDCSKPTLACKACGSPLARPMARNELRCILPACGQTIPLEAPCDPIPTS